DAVRHAQLAAPKSDPTTIEARSAPGVLDDVTAAGDTSAAHGSAATRRADVHRELVRRADAASASLALDEETRVARAYCGRPEDALPVRTRRRIAERIVGAGRGTIADRIAMTDAPDAFLLAARRRAADLAHVLPDDASTRLERALETLGRRLEPQALEDAYLSRCIRETDDEHRLRFELLALEGRMESEAAEAWFASIAEADEEEA
ncbi:MAG: hypothetical protein RL846_40995, partial [Deltaproteobacteria bacterium]